MTCINLREQFGKKYRITLDEAAFTKSEKADPWMQQIPCRGDGITIYPFGGDFLAVEVNDRGLLAVKLKNLGVKQTQDGDTEKTFIFPVSQFKQVAKIVHPCSKRRLTAAQKAAFKERVKEHQFKPDNSK